MADRYWVGGTASWDGTAGTKWATTSGGAGGAAIPTAADDVFFDAASGVNTVTIAAGNTGAKSINCTNFGGTLTGTAAITVSGSVTLVAGMTVTYSGTLTLAATGTLTSAGKTLGPVTVSGSGIAVTLGDAFVSSGVLTVTQGTFNTANFNVTATQLSSSNSNVRTITLGSSTVTLSAAAAVVFTTNTNLTLNANTSTIVCSATSATVTGGAVSATGVTFNNVSFTSTAASTHNIQSINTFGNLTVTAPAAAGVTQVTFDSRQTINGTLSTTGTAGNRRVWFRGVTYGIAQTLTVNASASLTDADFRDVYVVGTAAPISGTRIGNRGNCTGITFNTPKTVFWVTAAGGNWSGNNWAASSGGAASTDNFPLPQDTATIENTGLNTSATVTLDNVITYTGTVAMGTRTNAMTLSLATGYTVYGNWTNGSGTTLSGAQVLTFSSNSTQTIASAGKTFSGAITVDSYGGTVELADAFNIGSSTLTVTNGTFDAKTFNITAGAISSSNANVREIRCGSGTITLSSATPLVLTTTTNLTWTANTSQITLTATSAITFAGSDRAFYNVSFTATTSVTNAITGANTFNNLTLSNPASAGYITHTFSANQIITGTLTAAGATSIRRVVLRSDTSGTSRTLTVGTLSATDCDFQDITIAGTAAGSTPTRAGDRGNNSGITFTSKTVYWNLAGAQNWSATGWATSSGGAPGVNNFPLPQDTAVFDNAGSAGTVTFDLGWNIGTVDASARTTAMTLSTSTLIPFVYGDWKWGTGVTSSSTTGALTFVKRGTQIITSNGVTFGCPVTINAGTGTQTVQLADALIVEAAKTLTVSYGTFDAVTYNVTTGLFSAGNGTTIKMGTGTWTLSGTGTVWSVGTITFDQNTANIVLSDTSTTARTFAGSSLVYNKLTIGGATGISTTTITGNNFFSELASTKTVAHTIALGATTQVIDTWTVTGTAGNVVTVTGTASVSISGSGPTGLDYLALGTTTCPTINFFAGANSTGTGAGVFLTAKPASVNRYWVGGAGTWNATSTTNWSATSGGASGASVPTANDAVFFDQAGTYTVTMSGSIACSNFNVTGGTVTFSSGNITISGSMALLASSVWGAASLTFNANTSGNTVVTNGATIQTNQTVFRGIGGAWTLGSAFTASGGLNTAISITAGTLNLAGFTVSTPVGNANGAFVANNKNATINASSSSIVGARFVMSSGVFNAQTCTFSLQSTTSLPVSITGGTFNAGTSTINIASFAFQISGLSTTIPVTFYNVSLSPATGIAGISFSGNNTFNALSITGHNAGGYQSITFSNSQTIGTLTITGGSPTSRYFITSNAVGTPVTFTCTTTSLTNADFRDITIAGAAAPASGTRIGDLKGNSGFAFTSKTVYWNLSGAQNWEATGWATSSGGTPNANNFPLAQDTAVFDNTGSVTGTITLGTWNVGTIDMSARTSAMTLSTTTPTIFGNWINGSGTTLAGTGAITFSGRGTQQITSAGKTWTQLLTIDSLGGSVVLQDAFTASQSSASVLTVTNGTFNASTYNVTLSGAASGVASSNSNTRTIAIGSGTWTIAGTTGWNAATATNLSITGSGTISLTAASAKTFAGGGANYGSVTVDQGGAGTLTITGNNTFGNITNSYKATGAATIALGNTIQRVGAFTAAGEASRLLTITGASAASPAALVFTGGGAVNTDYLAITGIRAFPTTSSWYAGTNSVNNGSLGFSFSASPIAPALYRFFYFF